MATVVASDWQTRAQNASMARHSISSGSETKIAPHNDAKRDHLRHGLIHKDTPLDTPQLAVGRKAEIRRR